jgi:hypothetical protein
MRRVSGIALTDRDQAIAINMMPADQIQVHRLRTLFRETQTFSLEPRASA